MAEVTQTQTNTQKQDKPVMSEPRPKNNTIIIILVVVLLLCCCTGSTIGGIYLLSKAEEVPSDDDNPITTDDDPFVDDDSGDSEYSIAKVKKAFLDVTSYKFTGTVPFPDYTMKTEGSFISPNKEYYITYDDIGTIEEISVSKKHYIRYDRGDWEAIDEPYNGEIVRYNLLYVLSEIGANEEPEEVGNFLKYTLYDSEYDEDWTLEVDKSTYLPFKFVYVYYNDEHSEYVTETFYFTNYNDNGIEIDEPVIE